MTVFCPICFISMFIIFLNGLIISCLAPILHQIDPHFKGEKKFPLHFCNYLCFSLDQNFRCFYKK